MWPHRLVNGLTPGLDGGHEISLPRGEERQRAVGEALGGSGRRTPDVTSRQATSLAAYAVQMRRVFEAVERDDLAEAARVLNLMLKRTGARPSWTRSPRVVGTCASTARPTPWRRGGRPAVPPAWLWPSAATWPVGWASRGGPLRPGVRGHLEEPNPEVLLDDVPEPDEDGGVSAAACVIVGFEARGWRSSHLNQRLDDPAPTASTSGPSRVPWRWWPRRRRARPARPRR